MSTSNITNFKTKNLLGRNIDDVSLYTLNFINFKRKARLKLFKNKQAKNIFKLKRSKTKQKNDAFLLKI